jgi:hypothetical protein
MGHAEYEARRHAHAAIRLYTNAAMTENLSLYARMGFVETHRAIDQGSFASSCGARLRDRKRSVDRDCANFSQYPPTAVYERFGYSR